MLPYLNLKKIKKVFSNQTANMMPIGEKLPEVFHQNQGKGQAPGGLSRLNV